MAGHSKWKQIKRKKAVTDARRGAAFTKLIKEITMAAKAGGGNPAGNARLRLAIDTAKAANMPADNIERAIKKGTGELEGVNYEDVTCEGYGPGGAAILVECTTDNANRTVAELRNIFSKNGGNLGTAGPVAWMFDRRGQILLDATRQLAGGRHGVRCESERAQTGPGGLDRLRSLAGLVLLAPGPGTPRRPGLRGPALRAGLASARVDRDPVRERLPVHAARAAAVALQGGAAAVRGDRAGAHVGRRHPVGRDTRGRGPAPVRAGDRLWQAAGRGACLVDARCGIPFVPRPLGADRRRRARPALAALVAPGVAVGHPHHRSSASPSAGESSSVSPSLSPSASASPSAPIGELFEIRMEADMTEWTDKIDADSDAVWSASAGLAGSSGGMAVTVDDTNLAYWYKQISANGTGKVWARFYVDPNSIPMDAGEEIGLYQATDATTPIGFASLRYADSSYKIDASIYNDAVSPTTSTAITITDAEHWVEVYIQRASTSVSPGWAGS